MTAMSSSSLFEIAWHRQEQNQSFMANLGMYQGFVTVPEDVYVSMPADSPTMFSYQLQGEISELGEVLEADKRWKNMRNGHYDKGQKLEELADCFIYLMNMCMWSGYSFSDVEGAVASKVQTVRDRIRLHEQQQMLEQ